MDNKQRRQKIIDTLQVTKQAISASALAETFQVSRQVIVSDIALLRAQGNDIISTPKGYILGNLTAYNCFTFKVACHHSIDKTYDELSTIVDNGGKILDVIVEHPVYGQITGQLDITSRYDVEEFLHKLSTEKASLLSKLTDGTHLHTIACKDELCAKRIQEALKKLNLLLT